MPLARQLEQYVRLLESGEFEARLHALEEAQRTQRRNGH